MPDSGVETRLSALYSLIDGAVATTVLRNEPLPVEVPAAGLVIMRDGEPGEPEITFPLTYHYDHRVEVEIYARAAADRHTVTDARKMELGAAIAGDRRLGDLCDWVEVMATGADDLAVDGAAAIRIDPVLVVLSYAIANPLT